MSMTTNRHYQMRPLKTIQHLLVDPSTTTSQDKLSWTLMTLNTIANKLPCIHVDVVVYEICSIYSTAQMQRRLVSVSD